MKAIVLYVALVCSLFATALSSSHTEHNNSLSVKEAVVRDYGSFYTKERMLRIGVAFGAGAVMANTNIDENIQTWYQDNIRSQNSDEISKVAKEFGNGKIMIPLALLTAGVNFYDPDLKIGIWGVYLSRAYLVGAPFLLATQRLTGASRPGEKEYGSKWHPLEDENGVSGHAFMGAVPFLTLAHVYKDNPYIRYLAIAGSFLTALSRLNDNAHYASQIALGWYLAYESTDAVFEADRKGNTYSVSPMIRPEGYGVQVEMRF